MGFKRVGARGPRVAKTAQNHAWDPQVFRQEGGQDPSIYERELYKVRLKTCCFAL